MPIHTTSNGWLLLTENSAYAFELTACGYLVNTYWGGRLARLDDYPAPLLPERWGPDGSAHQIPEEYPVWGGLKYKEPCLKVTFADGVRDVVMRFMQAEIDPTDPEHLVLACVDAVYPLQIDLHYRIHESLDLIERWVTLRNMGHDHITIERMFSAQWHFPPGREYYLTHLHGRWLDEFHIQRELLTPGTKVLESRRITTSHHHNPWFAVDDNKAGEDSGQVWFGALVWSGNWKLTAEVTERQALEINVGLNDWDCVWQLESGASFDTPPCIGGYTVHGHGGARRQMHTHILEYILPHGSQDRQVLYNSWEATYFNVDEQSQMKLARQAAEIGVELFVVDDGWFHGRSLDNAGLGDWWPDAGKFPAGLGKLIGYVNQLGMDFGLWIEPEMVNPDSELYRRNPDWAIHFPTRQRSEARNQLILNVARLDVQEYILDTISTLLRDNNIRFIKWDMNRNVSEPGWQDAPGDPRELYIRYVQGLYRIWSELRRRFPHVIWESCSSGGGRSDLGILQYADQVWVSDNTEPTARLRIQEGYSCCFPAKTMSSWVTDTGDDWTSLEFRFHVSMCGVLGIGANLMKWNPEIKEKAAALIKQYKSIRPIIQNGEQYWLRSPHTSPFAALMYMDRKQKEGVLFAYRVHLPDPARLPPLFLRGLAKSSLYEIEGENRPRSGKAWMEAGLQLQLENFRSVIKRITRVDTPKQG